MPKIARELSDAAVRKLRWGIKKSEPGAGRPVPIQHPVGGVSGLRLYCRPPVAEGAQFARSWLLRVQAGDKRREIGLGSYPEVGLAEARSKAREIKEQIRQGVDPAAERRAKRSKMRASQAREVTFATVADRYVAKKAREYKNAVQATRLRSRINTYAIPALGHLLVQDIDRANVLDMLRPIWEVKTETATRVRLYVERILDLAEAEGLRDGANPARWAGNLELSLPQPSKVAKVQHQRSLPYIEMPDFWAKLKSIHNTSASVLAFTILTAARPTEARRARWEEIDLEGRVWVVPAERMKGGRVHRVPLSVPAVRILKSLSTKGGYLFLNASGNPLSDAYISRVPKLLGHDVTTHGFRSTFRTWAQECTEYAEEVCELSLAHVSTDATRAAYARGELLDRRRSLMEDWGSYCEGVSGANASASEK
jgi:integrase